MVSAQVSTMSFTDSPSRHITVVDIYDLAAVIGKDFERLIEHNLRLRLFVLELIFQVISALELLESFAGRNERESQEIDRLSLAVSRLEADKLEKKEGIIKFQQELEQIEENYKAEIRQSMDMVRKLQEENKRLCRALQSKELSPLQDSTERLERVNKELARKYKAVRLQGRSLVEEKTELISRLQDAEKAILSLQLRLGETLHEQSLDPDHVPKFTLAELREVLQEKNSLKARVMELEEELAQLRPSYDSSTSRGEEEILVYGPINREPEEKLYPWKYAKKNSGIRRL
ncbi:Jnk-SapK ap N and RILP domain containing protein [Trichuris trichiura]|uniref:Jnk-SapK ap N and RILP domain containing protein n=1 Tax=Trichuris trichiura TaxID=36087 RepID=A0A077Z427_TRITR|nr:Jnk-SapK ap N and RILP domain containing protein [Trichuris trichiura]